MGERLFWRIRVAGRGCYLKDRGWDGQNAAGKRDMGMTAVAASPVSFGFLVWDIK
jgi:hypothetical protein